MSEVRYAYRLPPCPAYDIEGTESWLTDLAADGLILSADGFFCGFGIFEKGEPQSLRYRLEAAPRPVGAFGEADPPSDEAVGIGESLGWRYVARRGDFYVYASAQPEACELNTDPAVQALALSVVTRRCRTALIDLIVELLLWCVIFPFIRADGRFLIPMINIGTLFSLWWGALVVWMIVSSARRFLSLRRLQKHLSCGGTIAHDKDWQRGARRHYLVRAAKILLIAAWIIVLVIRLSDGVMGKHEIPLAEYSDDPPFATLVDFVESPTAYEPFALFGVGNTVRVWSDILAPINYTWDELADVTAADGSVLDASLWIEYHEAVSPGVAHLLAKEYHRAARWESRDGFAPLSLDLEGFDYVAAYVDAVHIPTVVLQKGSVVICAGLYQHGAVYDPLPIEVWAGIVADSILS